VNTKANWGFLSSDHIEHVCMRTSDSGALIVTSFATENERYVGDYVYAANPWLWSAEFPSDMPEEYI
jgi:hypothetical protein